MSGFLCGIGVVIGLLSLVYGLIGVISLVLPVPADSNFPDGGLLSLTPTGSGGFIDLGVIMTNVFAILLMIFCSQVRVKCVLTALIGVNAVVLLLFFSRPSLGLLVMSQFFCFLSVLTEMLVTTSYLTDLQGGTD